MHLQWIAIVIQRTVENGDNGWHLWQRNIDRIGGVIIKAPSAKMAKLLMLDSGQVTLPVRTLFPPSLT